MSIVLVGSTSGSITLQEPAVAGSNTISLPAATGTAVLTGVSGTVDINAAGSNNVTLSTNSTERMRVDSSGNVGIGTSSPQMRVDVGSGGIRVQGIANPSSGSGMELAYDGTQGIIQVYSNRATLAPVPVYLVTGQLKFPPTQVPSSDANTLDDYEEGTWTPVLSRDGTAPSISYGVREGKYTKIGNMVTCWITINSITVSSAGTGNNIITGLPFAIGNSTYGGTGGFGYNDAFTNTVYGVVMTGGTTQVYFRGGARSSGNDNGGWTSGGYLGLTFSYFVN